MHHGLEARARVSQNNGSAIFYEIMNPAFAGVNVNMGSNGLEVGLELVAKCRIGRVFAVRVRVQLYQNVAWADPRQLGDDLFELCEIAAEVVARINAVSAALPQHQPIIIEGYCRFLWARSPFGN